MYDNQNSRTKGIKKRSLRTQTNKGFHLAEALRLLIFFSSGLDLKGKNNVSKMKPSLTFTCNNFFYLFSSIKKNKVQFSSHEKKCNQVIFTQSKFNNKGHKKVKPKDKQGFYLARALRFVFSSGLALKGKNVYIK